MLSTSFPQFVEEADYADEDVVEEEGAQILGFKGAYNRVQNPPQAQVCL